ncbi:hypothetical protein BC826DRAFT_1060359 [Russula brevipes]|nr:hypothetical protein BC826DRAFT_1060359 [Russula brevipes]
MTRTSTPPPQNVFIISFLASKVGSFYAHVQKSARRLRSEERGCKIFYPVSFDTSVLGP